MTASPAMKVRPILFSAPMVRALLDGSKTQTRRAVKHKWPYLWEEPCYPTGKVLANLPTQSGAWMEFRRREQDAVGYEGSPASTLVLCPYGQPGDRLWVKETTLKVEHAGWVGPVYVASDAGQQALEWGYGESDDPDFIEPFDLKKRSSLFMTRAMSRITLEITDVRVEPLQDISEADAIAEGIVRQRDDGFALVDTTHYHSADPRMSYWSLWETINGAGSVQINPWVWAVSFKRVTPS